MQNSNPEDYLKAQLERRTAALPDDVRRALFGMNPVEQSRWLDQYDAAQRRKSEAAQQLQGEYEYAKAVGMTPEQWDAAKKMAGR